MGCDAQWKKTDFPVTRELVYMNHAAVAPVSRPAAEAMKQLADEVHQFGSHYYSRWLEAYEGLRVAAARLVGGDKREIALVKNTSEGLATVANGIAWRPGDRVVGFEEEFPANYFPWKRLERQGVSVTWLSASDPLDRIEEACRGARLLALSFVQYLSGYRADLNAIGEICARHGCLFVVDAIQGLGAFPVDVRRAGIHALAADGHKWMLGPEGCGILYVRSDVQDLIEPQEIGWLNFASDDFGNRDDTLRADAGRYECGTLNTIGCFGLRASIEYLLGIGIECIAGRVQAAADRLADGAAGKGYELLGRRTPATGAGIVSLRKPGTDSRWVVSQLRQARIEAAARQGWVRASPHFYIDESDIDRVIETLP
jgi:selenocysteine lyase/cysteine desulfurase